MRTIARWRAYLRHLQSSEAEEIQIHTATNTNTKTQSHPPGYTHNSQVACVAPVRQRNWSLFSFNTH